MEQSGCSDLIWIARFIGMTRAVAPEKIHVSRNHMDLLKAVRAGNGMSFKGFLPKSCVQDELVE